MADDDEDKEHDEDKDHDEDEENGEDEEGALGATAEPVDPTQLPGETVFDQEQMELGEIKKVFETEDGWAMWVSIEASFGMNDKRTVYAPIARLKQEGDQILVPYSQDHMKNCPELESEDEITEEEEQTLRDHYGMDTADQELRDDNKSYAAHVPVERGTPAKATDEPSDTGWSEDEQDENEDENEDEQEGGSSEDGAESGRDGQGQESEQQSEGEASGNEK